LNKKSNDVRKRSMNDRRLGSNYGKCEFVKLVCSNNPK